jgi:putative ATPase
MGLFTEGGRFDPRAPLADRMRPRNFEEFVGQQEIVAVDKPLRKLLLTDTLPSMIFWGPPGSGKTTLAYLIADAVKLDFIPFSAVTASIKEVKEVIEVARAKRGLTSKPTILFIDEIHRFNRVQQDAFLPHIERGVIVLIGATTENPSFEIISPLLSRCRVFILRQLSMEEVILILRRAIEDPERGLGKERLCLQEGVLEAIAGLSNGDARIALNLLEISVFCTPYRDGRREVTLTTIRHAAQKRHKLYDKDREEHYNLISAFIKSMRGSDPDAALYWMARMLESGEDPLYIARRMVRFASEDIGNADPQALVIAISAKEAVDFIGMPECNNALAQAAVYLATAPKSNSIMMAYEKAAKDVEEMPNLPVPLHLRNPVTELMKDAGYGKGYKYAHQYPNGIDRQKYMPENLEGRRYYKPKDIGFEREIKRRIQERDRRRQG